jgi:hypothetical protein
MAALALSATTSMASIVSTSTVVAGAFATAFELQHPLQPSPAVFDSKLQPSPPTQVSAIPQDEPIPENDNMDAVKGYLVQQQAVPDFDSRPAQAILPMREVDDVVAHDQIMTALKAIWKYLEDIAAGINKGFQLVEERLERIEAAINGMSVEREDCCEIRCQQWLSVEYWAEKLHAAASAALEARGFTLQQVWTWFVWALYALAVFVGLMTLLALWIAFHVSQFLWRFICALWVLAVQLNRWTGGYLILLAGKK